MKKYLPTFAAIFFIFASCAWAGDAPTLKEINQQEADARLFDSLNRYEVLLDRIDRNFRMACAKAVGYEPFCNCIASEIPMVWDFSDYIAITTKTKDENGYGKLTPDRKSAYDRVSSVRDKCVALINKKP